MIYTKTGDGGTTSLVGGSRVSKDDVRVEAYGTVDELNSHIGLLAEMFRSRQDGYYDELKSVQRNLFTIQTLLATEDEAPQSRLFSLKKILGGDILYTSFVRRQIWLFMLIGAFLIVYIGSRYSCQQDLIQIDKLQVKLKDAKYKALSSTSQLTEISRESNVIELLKNNKDSVLKIPSAPPYKIEVPEEGK